LRLQFGDRPSIRSPEEGLLLGPSGAATQIRIRSCRVAALTWRRIEALLETNVIIALFGREQTVLNRLAGADAVFVPVVALGELYYGARKSGRAEQNLQRIDEFAAAATLLDCNQATAKQ